MALPGEQIVYAPNVEDIRNAVAQEGFRELSDEEILKLRTNLATKSIGVNIFYRPYGASCRKFRATEND